MKIELEDKDIERIVERLFARLTPLFKHNSKSNDNELMTVEEVAKYLNNKKSTIYEKVHTKSIPFLKNGTLLRFRRKDIDIWLLNPYHPDLSHYNLNHNGRG